MIKVNSKKIPNLLNKTFMYANYSSTDFFRFELVKINNIQQETHYNMMTNSTIKIVDYWHINATSVKHSEVSFCSVTFKILFNNITEVAEESLNYVNVFVENIKKQLFSVVVDRSRDYLFNLNIPIQDIIDGNLQFDLFDDATTAKIKEIKENYFWGMQVFRKFLTILYKKYGYQKLILKLKEKNISYELYGNFVMNWQKKDENSTRRKLNKNTGMTIKDK